MYIGRTGVKRDTKQRHRSDEKYENVRKMTVNMYFKYSSLSQFPQNGDYLINQSSLESKYQQN